MDEHLFGEDDKLRNWLSFSGRLQTKRLAEPGGSFTSAPVQSTGRPVVHISQAPQKTERQVTT